MATLSQWIAGARPRTLPAAVSPVLVGTGAAYGTGDIVWSYALLALVVAMSLQVGVNFANDYSDGVRGTDDERVGPLRLVGRRLAAPATVKFAAWACFLFAALCGLALIALSGLWVMIPIGMAAVAAGWYYTGGSRPYGYQGLGEVFVFVFFGLVATLGTMATMTALTAPAWLGAIGVGALASAILVANNLRDIPTDRERGKLTLAVRMGDRGSRTFYLALVAAAYVVTPLVAISAPFALLALLATPVMVSPVRAILGGRQGLDLIPVLTGTGIFQLAWSAMLAIGLALAHHLG